MHREMPDYWHENQRDAAPDYVEISHTTGTVKRGRKCSTCGKTMPPGTRYESRKYTMDGEFMSDQTCIEIGPEHECPLRASTEEPK